jgi:hypothetical protein
LVLLPVLMQSTRDGWMVVGWWKRTSMRVVLVVAKEIEKFGGGREVGKLDDNHSVFGGCNFLVLWLTLSEREASAF